MGGDELPWPGGVGSRGRRATKGALRENGPTAWSHHQDMGLRKDVRSEDLQEKGKGWNEEEVEEEEMKKEIKG